MATPEAKPYQNMAPSIDRSKKVLSTLHDSTLPSNTMLAGDVQLRPHEDRSQKTQSIRNRVTGVSGWTSDDVIVWITSLKLDADVTELFHGMNGVELQVCFGMSCDWIALILLLMINLFTVPVGSYAWS